MEYVCHSLEETKQLALRLIEQFNPRKVNRVLLTGDLGSGKTTLVQQMASLLGVEEVVQSPTYVIRKDYSISGVFTFLTHIDMYRLREEKELEHLEWDDLQTKGRIICVEWPEQVKLKAKEEDIKILASSEAGVHTFIVE